jgi:predicted nucleotidyltransferase
MTINIPQTVEFLKDALLRQLGDEVDLIFRYGSLLKGTAHQYSDLDISFVPVHDTTWHSITVLVENTMIDFYPMHWSHLERMSTFDDISATVLLEHEIVYQRSEAAAARFRGLAARLREMQQPENFPVMLQKAQSIFEQLGYQYYLLRQQAERGHLLSCMQHSRHILRGVVHCLAVCNQATIDTRKLNQVLSLAKLPTDFASSVDLITNSTDPTELLTASENLMQSTRALLLAEQNRLRTDKPAFPEVFGAGYPELKGDLNHLMLACERRDLYNFNFMSLYHELMIHIGQALTGIPYSGFNTIEEYEQDLVALGFPDLLSYVVAKDYDGLHQQCQVFDQRLQAYLTERGVSLYTFATLNALREHLR